MSNEQRNANMLYKDAFQSAMALKLGIVSTALSSLLSVLTTPTAIAVSLPTLQQPEETLTSGYYPPSDQRQPPHDEETETSSGGSDTDRRLPRGTEENDSFDAVEGDRAPKPMQPSADLETSNSQTNALTELQPEP